MRQSKYSVMKYTLIATFLISHAFSWFVYTTTASVWKIYINTKSVQKKIDKKGNSYAFYKTPSISVIQPKQFSFLFYPYGTTAGSLVRNGECSTALNGTYFWRNPDKTFFPAGIWYAFGSLLTPIYKPATDPNLQVLLWSDGKKISFFDNNTFDFSGAFARGGDWIWYLNSWPWLVRDGKINYSVVDFTSHWQKKTTRSGIVTNPDGSVYFVVSTQNISLPQFVTFVFTSGIWTGAFQFVNIDGGSSSSLKTPFTTFKSNQNLPIFICVD